MLHLLPDIFLQVLVNQYLSSIEAKTLRLVSKSCRSLVDSNISALQPRDLERLQVILSIISTGSCLMTGSR